jgi:DNA-binding SARP family transcriptional activator
VMGSHDGAAEAVRVRLLGGFSVSVGSRVVEANGWRRRSAASLVKVLALARGHRLRRDRMLDILWPELDERTAAGNLHRALHFARRAFEPDASRSSARYLALVDGMVSLCPEEPLWVDAEEFERAAAARRSRDPAAYRAAIELYAGELLPADSDEEWSHESRDALRESHLALLAELAALHEERGARARRAWRWRSPAASPASTPTAYGSWSSPPCRTPSWCRGRWRRLWACASNPANRSPPTSGPGTRCWS